MKITVMSLLGLFVLTTTVAVAAGEEDKTCPGAPSMTVESACRRTSGARATYELCRDALRGVPDPLRDHDVTGYALAAAEDAMASEDATVGAATELLTRNRSLSGEERDAYAECQDAYAYAEHAMGAAVRKLRACSFGGLGDDYMDGLLAVERCRDRVIRLPASPLYAMVLVDRNKAGLALFLGKLLGI